MVDSTAAIYRDSVSLGRVWTDIGLVGLTIMGILLIIGGLHEPKGGGIFVFLGAGAIVAGWGTYWLAHHYGWFASIEGADAAVSLVGAV